MRRASCSPSIRRPASCSGSSTPVPMNPGDPGLETWPNLDAARHGGGQAWIPGSYDPETRLYIFGTGNPTPGYTGVARPGDNLFTCSLVAVNVDTGKMAWYFQTSAHDTHDWDSAQTPILIDGVINGKPRKLVSTAARNGYFYTLDRVTGEHIVTSKYGTYANWAQGHAADRRRLAGSQQGSDDSRLARLAGRRRRHQLAAAARSRRTPACSTCRSTTASTCSTSPIPIRAARWALAARRSTASDRSATSSRRSTTAPARSRGGIRFPGGGGGGLLTTAGGWCSPATAAATSSRSTPPTASRCGTRASATSRMRRRPISVDGRQHVLVAVGDTLYAFMLPQRGVHHDALHQT